MEISKFARFHGYLSSVSLRLLMVYPNICLSWFTRQLDLELMFTSTISLRTANWIKREKLFRFILTQYLHRLDPSQDPICPNCQEEKQDLGHCLRDCPALSSVRQLVFGCHQGSLQWLATRHGDVVAYARKTLVNLGA